MTTQNHHRYQAAYTPALSPPSPPTQENVLTLDVVEAQPPPSSTPSHPHPDWVSTLDAGAGDLVLTGCYDGVVRVFAAGAASASVSADKALCEGVAHTGPIKAVRWFPRAGGAGAAQGAPHARFCVSGGKDMVARVWRMSSSAKGKGVDGAEQLSVVGLARGHGDAVETVAVSQEEDSHRVGLEK